MAAVLYARASSFKADTLEDGSFTECSRKEIPQPVFNNVGLSDIEKAPLCHGRGKYSHHKHYVKDKSISKEECRCVFGDILGSGAVQDCPVCTGYCCPVVAPRDWVRTGISLTAQQTALLVQCPCPLWISYGTKGDGISSSVSCGPSVKVALKIKYSPV